MTILWLNIIRERDADAENKVGAKRTVRADELENSFLMKEDSRVKRANLSEWLQKEHGLLTAQMFLLVEPQSEVVENSKKQLG